ncbi:hypothetical protein EDC01DRAFT_780914 [Geopyxis carbonaria]|nr:hypothetical protein EDC01DRAFT_780914 [Geopyxis carbonaria]
MSSAAAHTPDAAPPFASNYTDATPSPPPSLQPPAARPGPALVTSHSALLPSASLANVCKKWISPCESDVHEACVLADIIDLPDDRTYYARHLRTDAVHLPDAALFGTEEWEGRPCYLRETNAWRVRFNLQCTVEVLGRWWTLGPEVVNAEMLWVDGEGGEGEEEGKEGSVRTSVFMGNVPGLRIPVEVRQIRTAREREEGGVEVGMVMHVWTPKYMHWLLRWHAKKVCRQMVERLETIV